MAYLIINYSEEKMQKMQKKGGSELQEINWDRTCYPKEMITDCLKFIQEISHDKFGPVNDIEYNLLENKSDQLEQKYGIKISVYQLITMRRMEIALNAFSPTIKIRALQNTKKILNLYSHGESVLTIADKVKLPPLMVLYQILEGNSKTEIKNMISNPALMPPRLSNELLNILKADLSSRLNSDIMAKQSLDYENAVGQFLHNLNIQFQTENDLRLAKQDVILTPDFLLNTPIIINQSPVYWIDAKNYPMYGSLLVKHKLIKQAAKYTKVFGPGAMIFSGGIMCSSNIQALLLDGSHIPMKS